MLPDLVAEATPRSAIATAFIILQEDRY